MDLIDISRDTKSEGRNRRQREPRQQTEQRRREKRKAARRKTMRKFVGSMIATIVVLALALEGGHVLIKAGLEKLAGWKGDTFEVERDFSVEETDIEKPVAITSEEELQTRLAQLVAEHPECAVLQEQQELYPEDLLKAVCNNTEMIEFALAYPTTAEASKDGILAEDSQEGMLFGGSASGKAAELTKEEKKETFPLLIQWDERWGYHSYGGSVIGLSGCGPTCLSIVVTGLTGQDDITPNVVADYAMENGYYLDGTGTMWSLMDEGCRVFGVTGSQISADKETILNYLENGNPIICSVGPGDFTAAGHFIVLVGTEDGKIIVNDPNSRMKSEVLWSYESIESQIKSLWVYHKNS